MNLREEGREGEIRTREEGTFADVGGTDNEDAGPLLQRFTFSDYLLIHLLLLLPIEFYYARITQIKAFTTRENIAIHLEPAPILM